VIIVESARLSKCVVSPPKRWSGCADVVRDRCRIWGGGAPRVSLALNPVYTRYLTITSPRRSRRRRSRCCAG